MGHSVRKITLKFYIRSQYNCILYISSMLSINTVVTGLEATAGLHCSSESEKPIEWLHDVFSHLWQNDQPIISKDTRNDFVEFSWPMTRQNLVVEWVKTSKDSDFNHLLRLLYRHGQTDRQTDIATGQGATHQAELVNCISWNHIHQSSVLFTFLSKPLSPVKQGDYCKQKFCLYIVTDFFTTCTC